MGLQVEIAERSSVIVVTLTGPTDIEALEPLHDASQVAASEGQTVVLDPVGTFARQLFLGETLDADAIAADYHAEVLTLAIPVREAAKPRKLAGLATDEWCSGQSGRELAPDRGGFPGRLLRSYARGGNWRRWVKGRMSYRWLTGMV